MINETDIRDMDDAGLMERRAVFDRIRKRFIDGSPAHRRVMAREEAAWFEYTVMLEAALTALWKDKLGGGFESMAVHEGPSKPSQM